MLATLIPISDAGEQGFFTTKIGGIVGALLCFSIVFMFMFPIYILTNHGIVYWSYYTSSKMAMVSCRYFINHRLYSSEHTSSLYEKENK